MAAIHPQIIKGNWHTGYALDLHTKNSTLLAVDGHGYKTFETVYSELGGLLYRLKSKADRSVVPEIVSTAAGFLRPGRSRFDLIVPVPPSRVRKVQPVRVLAQGIGAALDKPVALDCIGTTRSSTPLKDVSDPARRKVLLAGLYTAKSQVATQKKVLLFDDLFRSGSTMNAITDVLLRQGLAARVYALTITRTRSNR